MFLSLDQEAAVKIREFFSSINTAAVKNGEVNTLAAGLYFRPLKNCIWSNSPERKGSDEVDRLYQCSQISANAQLLICNPLLLIEYTYLLAYDIRMKKKEKLTLYMDEKSSRAAHELAASLGKSVSELVREYTAESRRKLKVMEIAPEVSKWIGILKTKKSYKKLRDDHITARL